MAEGTSEPSSLIKTERHAGFLQSNIDQTRSEQSDYRLSTLFRQSRFEEIRFRMNEGKSQPWYQLYASAVLELEPEQIIERVDAAEAAIHGRLRDLQYDSDHHEERQLMEDARRTLSFLRRSPETMRL
ncbi:MAG: hypothetical protein WB755_20330 [Terriglobales bacterium]